MLWCIAAVAGGAVGLLIFLALAAIRLRKTCVCSRCSRRVPKWFAQDCGLPQWHHKDIRCRNCLSGCPHAKVPSWLTGYWGYYREVNDIGQKTKDTKRG